MRTFISLNLGLENGKLIAEYRNKFRNLLTEDEKRKIKWEADNKYHVTILFIGESSQKQIDEICKNMQTAAKSVSGEICFKLKGVSAFPDLTRPRVIIVDMVDTEGKAKLLSREINKTMSVLGFRNDKPFKPHITIGRVKRYSDLCLNGMDFKCEQELIKITKISLMKSVLSKEGSSYEEIYSISF